MCRRKQSAADAGKVLDSWHRLLLYRADVEAHHLLASRPPAQAWQEVSFSSDD